MVERVASRIATMLINIFFPRIDQFYTDINCTHIRKSNRRIFFTFSQKKKRKIYNFLSHIQLRTTPLFLSTHFPLSSHNSLKVVLLSQFSTQKVENNFPEGGGEEEEGTFYSFHRSFRRNSRRRGVLLSTLIKKIGENGGGGRGATRYSLAGRRPSTRG